MPHQYDNSPQKTEIERYFEKNQLTDRGQRENKEYADKRYAEITSAYRKNNTVTIEEVISRHRPHEDFIKLYESNVAKEQQEAQLKALRDARNAQGELLAKVYNTQAYQAVHDPNGCLINRSLH